MRSVERLLRLGGVAENRTFDKEQKSPICDPRMGVHDTVCDRTRDGGRHLQAGDEPSEA